MPTARPWKLASLIRLSCNHRDSHIIFQEHFTPTPNQSRIMHFTAFPILASALRSYELFNKPSEKLAKVPCLEQVQLQGEARSLFFSFRLRRVGKNAVLDVQYTLPNARLRVGFDIVWTLKNGNSSPRGRDSGIRPWQLGYPRRLFNPHGEH